MASSPQSSDPEYTFLLTCSVNVLLHLLQVFNISVVLNYLAFLNDCCFLDNWHGPFHFTSIHDVIDAKSWNLNHEPGPPMVSHGLDILFAWWKHIKGVIGHRNRVSILTYLGVFGVYVSCNHQGAWNLTVLPGWFLPFASRPPTSTSQPADSFQCIVSNMFPMCK